MNTTLPGIELPPPLQPATTTPPAWRELCKTVKLVTPDGRDTWNLVVQPINHFETQLALDNIGRLNDPSISLYSAADHRPEQVAARLWKQSGVTVAALLKSSPFWLDALTRPRLLVNPDSPQEYLVRYRLADICLAALSPSVALIDVSGWETTRALLLRQRFRYLVTLADLPEVSRYVPDYEEQLRSARAALAHVLLDRDNIAAQAFALADSSPAGSWDLERELRFLVFRADGGLQPIAATTTADRQLTDDIVRRGFLGRNNLQDASHTVAGLLARHNGAASAARLLPFFHTWFIVCTLFAAASFWLGGMSRQAGWNWAILAGFVAAVIIPALAWTWVWSQPGLQRAAVYPLALRVPSLALLGLSVVAGISGYLPYAFNAWNWPWIGWFVFLVSPTVTFGYILFETLVRVSDRRVAVRRAMLLTAYLWAATFWLALLIGLFAEPVGMTCPGGQGPCDANDRLVLIRFVVLLGTRVSTDFVFFVGSLSLLVGLLTQLFWEERSVAEPL